MKIFPLGFFNWLSYGHTIHSPSSWSEQLTSNDTPHHLAFSLQMNKLLLLSFKMRRHASLQFQIQKTQDPLVARKLKFVEINQVHKIRSNDQSRI